MQLSPKAHLLNAHGLLSNALVGLQHCIDQADKPVYDYGDPLAISLDQSGDWLIGELEHAVSQMRSAKARIAEKALRQTPVRYAEAAE